MHAVDVDALAHAGARVTGEVEVGHGVGDERIVVVDKIHKGGGFLGGDLAALDTGDQLGDHLLRRHVEQVARHGRAQALGVDLADVEEVVHQLDLAGGIGDRLGDLVDVINDLNAVFAQHAGEVVVLLLRDLEIGHIVEQQTFERGRGQRFQLLAGAVQQHLVELSDLGEIMDAWIHSFAPFPGMPAALSSTAHTPRCDLFLCVPHKSERATDSTSVIMP